MNLNLGRFYGFESKFCYLNLERPAPFESLFKIYFLFLNLDVGATPTGTSSSGGKLTTWGDWIVDTAGLDKTKWKVNGTGIEPIYQFNGNNSQGCGVVITINPSQANKTPDITFDPDALGKAAPASSNSLCKGLKRGYI